MSKRLLCLTLLTMITLTSSGCQCIYCLHDNLISAYKARRWYDCGCGDTYWGPWLDTPPGCCDPCDCQGNFTAGRRYWTPGNQWRQGGVPMGAPGMAAPVFDDGMDGVPTPQTPGAPGQQVPTPAEPPANMNMAPPSAPPSGPPTGPPVRSGYRPHGMAARVPNPYNSSYTYPPTPAQYFQGSSPAW